MLLAGSNIANTAYKFELLNGAGYKNSIKIAQGLLPAPAWPQAIGVQGSLHAFMVSLD
jgi:hypothetical protein